MKKFLFFLSAIVVLFGSTASFAQTFSIEKDTVRLTYLQGTGLQFMRDSIVPGASSTIIDWRVIATNFPADWLATSPGICDNQSCYPMSLLWPSGATKTSLAYGNGAGYVRDFHLQLNLTGATTAGTYYVVVRLNGGTTDTTQVYSVTFAPTAIHNISKSMDEISLYPNPTNNDINVVYDANADIKTISVYNIIGKALAVYKPTAENSANLSLENVPAGIYFLRLINSKGEVVVTRKFTKQ